MRPKRHAKSLIDILKQQYGLGIPFDGVEVGVWRGEMSGVLLDTFLLLHLVMVDVWEDMPPTATMRKPLKEILDAKKLATLVMRKFPSRCTTCQMTSEQAAAHLSGCVFDFVFIDACHLYDSVKEDIAVWSPLVSKGGIICGHDYNGVGDRKHGWGVKQAVDEAFGSAVRVEPGLIWWVRLGSQYHGC